MGVAELLELPGVHSERLLEAEQRWEEWAEDWPILGRIDGTRDLRAWTKRVGPAMADEGLHALAAIAAHDGGDDPAAAAALSWTLLPSAVLMAHGLRAVSPDIDHVVASQLWIEIRSFPWRRLRKVAANILLNTRSAVLAECGVSLHVRRVDPAWARTHIVDSTAPIWNRPALQLTDPLSESTFLDEKAELAHVFEWAIGEEVITEEERVLLLDLVAQAYLTSTRSSRRGAAGLLANELTAQVAARRGVAATTVRRRARRSLDALAAACATDGFRLSA
jgi:hypothetical protein